MLDCVHLHYNWQASIGKQHVKHIVVICEWGMK